MEVDIRLSRNVSLKDLCICIRLDSSTYMMRSLANSEDPDEIQHNAAFHLGLHCLL